MRLLRESDKSFITLDEAATLGVGGEARIYALAKDPALAAKVYHNPTDTHARKLIAMLWNPPEDPQAAEGHHSIAWPVDLLRAERGRQIVGFLMRRVRGARPLIHFYNPSARRQVCPFFSYAYLHRTARNLAAALHALHARDYVVGDINESNILVADTALVTLVDTDSFQVRDARNGAIYRCRVGKAEYTPPELQGIRFVEVERLPVHDRFGLAVLIFMLLMEGAHPFEGVYTGGGDPPPYEARIQAGHFPYATERPVPYRPRPAALPMEVLHPTLRQMFIQCFEHGHSNPRARPDAITWHSVLTEAEESLVTCRINAQHRYGQHLDECPWCQRKELLGGRDPFPSRQDVRRGLHLQPPPSALPRNLDAAVAIAPVQRPRPVPARNTWAWAAAGLGLLASLPLLHLWAGIAAFLTGAIGYLRAGAPARRDKWLAGSAMGVGLAAVLLTLLPVAVPWRLSLISDRPDLEQRMQHAGWVRCVAFSPDAKLLASGSYDNTIKLWDPQTHTLQRTLSGHGDVIQALAISPNSKLLASASRDYTLKMWDLQTGALVQTFSGHDSWLSSIAFSPDGTCLLTGSWDKTAILWNVATAQPRFKLEKHAGPVLAVAFSADAKLIATAGRDHAVGLWDAESGKLLHFLDHHADAVNAVAFSPVAPLLASASNDKTVRLWNPLAGTLLVTLAGHEDAVLAVAFSPDGKTLASAGRDRTVRLWDVNSATPLKTLTGHTDAINALAFSPVGRILATASDDKTLQVWRTE